MAAEMQSFIWKFMQLTNLGYDANLDVKSNQGKIQVCLQVELNDSQAVYPQQHPVLVKPMSNARSRRRRRRLRRKTTDSKEANMTNTEEKSQSLSSEKLVPVGNSVIYEVSKDSVKENASPLPIIPVITAPKDQSTQTDEKTIPFGWMPLPPRLTLQPTLQPLSSSSYQYHPSFPSKCPDCQKEFQAIDDYKWHNDTKYGREDCQILRSML